MRISTILWGISKTCDLPFMIANTHNMYYLLCIPGVTLVNVFGKPFGVYIKSSVISVLIGGEGLE